MDTYFSHDSFNHLASLKVIGLVNVSGYIGVLLQQLHIGIVHSAEDDRYFSDFRMIARHQ